MKEGGDMKIAITATGNSLDAEVDPRLGRCQYFIIADPQTMEFEAVDNSSAMAAGGAGIAAAQMIAAKGVEAILTGNCGPNAHQVLSSAGIQVITGVSGKVKDAIEGYRDGKFKTSSQPNVSDHFGMSADPGMGGGMGGGMGRGMGRGMGKGMGRGMGRGMGMGMGGGMMPPAEPAFPTSSPEIEALRKQLSAIEKRLEQLENKGK
jgi:predicted Fe-Mo cluster-binding NifX family protein